MFQAKHVLMELILIYLEAIKIDHHPFVEEFCNIEWIDDTASSTAQMILN